MLSVVPLQHAMLKRLPDRQSVSRNMPLNGCGPTSMGILGLDVAEMIWQPALQLLQSNPRMLLPRIEPSLLHVVLERLHSVLEP